MKKLPLEIKARKDISFSRTWASANRWTFLIKPIKELLEQELGSGFLLRGQGIDPFAGKNSPAQLTNDLNPDTPTTEHMDALEFLKQYGDDEADFGIYDPPYSLRQAVECYKSFGMENHTSEVSSMKYWADCKDELARIIKPGGKALCFGWNSMGLGKSRGFELKHILLVPHGGSRNDTICTVEVKV